MPVVAEALIEVPPKMLDSIMRAVEKRLLWLLRDRLAKLGKDYPEHRREFKKYVAERGYTLPRERFPDAGDTTFLRAPIDVSGMGPQYAHLKPDRDEIAVGIDWGGKTGYEDSAAWINKTKSGKSILLILPCNNNTFRSYPRAVHPEDVRYIADTLRESVRHELRHMVQSVLIRHPAQQKLLPKYGERGSDYYASPIEFDTLIGSAVDEFVTMARVVMGRASNFDLKRAIRTFTAATKTRLSRFEAFAPAPLFRYLKARSPQKWQRAVKKFLVELKRRLPELAASK